jgi:hypothetical protein
MQGFLAQPFLPSLEELELMSIFALLSLLIKGINQMVIIKQLSVPLPSDEVERICEALAPHLSPPPTPYPTPPTHTPIRKGIKPESRNLGRPLRFGPRPGRHMAESRASPRLCQGGAQRSHPRGPQEHYPERLPSSCARVTSSRLDTRSRHVITPKGSPSPSFPTPGETHAPPKADLTGPYKLYKDRRTPCHPYGAEPSFTLHQGRRQSALGFLTPPPRPSNRPQ